MSTKSGGAVARSVLTAAVVASTYGGSSQSRRDGVILSVGSGDSTSFVFEKIQYRYQDKLVSDLARST